MRVRRNQPLHLHTAMDVSIQYGAGSSKSTALVGKKGDQGFKVGGRMQTSLSLGRASSLAKVQSCMHAHRVFSPHLHLA